MNVKSSYHNAIIRRPRHVIQLEFYIALDRKIDKVATFGIAALVAGGLIGAKLGFFKLFWVFLIAAKKFIIIGVIAVVAFFKKLFKREGVNR
jgi:uncharacterized membrane-anchored protein